MTGSVRDFYDRSGTSKQYQVGYNNAWRSVNYGFSALRTDDRLTPKINQKVSVGDARLAAANIDTMADAGIAFDQVAAHSPALAADALGRLGAGSVQVVEQFELA